MKIIHFGSPLLAGIVMLALSFTQSGCSTETKGEMNEIKLEPITADQLEKAIAAHKGKVVLIDVWGEY